MECLEGDLVLKWEDIAIRVVEVKVWHVRGARM